MISNSLDTNHTMESGSQLRSEHAMSDTSPQIDIVLVAAVAENNVIGDDGSIPWHIPHDLERFRDMTTGNPVIMGRRTFASIINRNGHPLPDRDTIVLTTHHRNHIDTGDADNGGDVHVATSIDAAVDAARRLGSGTVYVAGGESVYRQFIDIADRIELTRVHATYDGDAEFPTLDDAWHRVAREQHSGDDVDYTFVTYERTA